MDLHAFEVQVCVKAETKRPNGSFGESVIGHRFCYFLIFSGQQTNGISTGL